MMKVAMNMNTLPVMGSSYFYFTKARFFAGLFCRPISPNLLGT